MLAFAFFSLIFSSLLWFIFAVKFINESLAGISFFDAGIANILLYTVLVCVPIFLIWAVFGYINQYLNNKTVNLQLRKLMSQMKKNQDYSDLLARVMIEMEQHINDGFILNKFDLLIADMNELLSEIIKGCKFASNEQIENLWAKVQNGGKWSFGKVIIEVNNAQPNFKKRVYEHAVYNSVLGGTIMEFCARYQAVVKMLENHDKDKLFLDIIETGVMGKVYSILSPVSAEIQRGKETFAAMPRDEEVFIEPDSRINPVRNNNAEETKPEGKKEKASILKKINLFGHKDSRKESDYQEPEKDPFSIALERSFSNDSNVSAIEQAEAPRISMPTEEEIVQEASPSISIPSTNDYVSEPRFEIGMTDTQKTIDGLKKEWAEGAKTSQISESGRAVDENYVYPFGSWTDEQNYQK